MRVDERIFKAYDIRGTYPDQLNEEIAYLIGGAIVNVIRGRLIAVGRDVRVSSPALERALVRGITDAGADVVIMGVIPTDAMYFAVGKYEFDGGVMVTASHNPPEYNGFKISRAQAIPLSGDEGLPEIKRIVMSGKFRAAKTPGTVHSKEILEDYINHCLSFINIDELLPFKIAIDATNGVAGIVLERLLQYLPFKVIKLFFEPDGRFPNHLPDPMDEKNREALRQAVLKNKCDFGVIFDGDADRMFMVDEHGEFIGGDMIVAMVARKMLSIEPGATIVHNLICSKVVDEIIEKYGGKAVRSRVGHAFLKPLMRQHNAIFGGEHSGHYFFRDHWYADSGMIAFLVATDVLSQEEKKPSELIAEMDHYFRSGEINTRVSDRWRTIECVAKKVEELTGQKADRLDGITFDFGEWWFNIRPSNTEPLLRLNVEATSKELMEEKRDWILGIIEECK